MSQTHERRSTTGTPRWVKIFGVIAIVLILVFAVLHLSGHGMEGMYSMPNQQSMQQP